MTLFEAVEAGDVGLVRASLESGPDLNASCGDGKTALHLAARAGHAEIVRLLLEAGASVHARDAASPLGEPEEGCQTALVDAVESQHAGVAIVNLLLDAGAFVDARDLDGRTPLMAAAFLGRVELVERLLAAGANAGAKTRWGRTALKEAAIHADRRLTKLLTDAAGPAKDEQSVAEALNAAIFRGRLDVFEDLIGSGANVNIPRKYDGVTPLFTATMLGRTDVVRRLLDLGADPRLARDQGDTPLHVASQFGSLPIVQLLLEAGASPDARGEFGRTPLLAIAHEWGQHFNPLGVNTAGKLACARALIAAKADLGARDDNGQTAIEVAASAGHQELVALFREAGAGTGGLAEAELRHAAREGNLERVRELIAAGTNVNAIPSVGMTPLIAASHKGHVEVVRALIAAGADVRSPREFGSTALHFAVWDGHAEVVRILIAAGADVNATSGNRPHTLACDAIAKGWTEVLRLLLDAGADPDAVPDSKYGGGPALHLAASHSSPEAVRLLLAAGADPNLPSPFSRSTALHAAIESGQIANISLLLAAGANPDLPDGKGVTPRDLARASLRADIERLLG